MDSTALSANSLSSVHLQRLSSAEVSELISPLSSIAESPEPIVIEFSPQTVSVEEQEMISEPPIENQPKGFWKIFLSTFVTIFLAELGDKTQVTTLLMSAESQSPWIVFAGAGSALIATSLIGVLLGQWLANRISPKTLDMASGVVLLLITVGLVWDVLKF